MWWPSGCTARSMARRSTGPARAAAHTSGQPQRRVAAASLAAFHTIGLNSAPVVKTGSPDGYLALVGPALVPGLQRDVVPDAPAQQHHAARLAPAAQAQLLLDGLPALAGLGGARPVLAPEHPLDQPLDVGRPAFADERPVYLRLPTFGVGLRRRQTAVTLNRSQRSSTCRALSFSARSLRSPLRSKMA